MVCVCVCERKQRVDHFLRSPTSAHGLVAKRSSDYNSLVVSAAANLSPCVSSLGFLTYGVLVRQPGR